ncbi:MAG: tRNA epoxyqueuosine(34) reductase QueG [Bacteroidetes bacterium]|nr:tRNA epoxyqueuosine(34) reductase QueG [Bacteroidota bacterium]
MALGFSHFGIAPAGEMEEEHRLLEAWLAAGRHGNMAWLEKDPSRRCDPTRVLEGARSVISVAMNYYSPEAHDENPDIAKISRYAWGSDYHDLIGERLERLERRIAEELPGERTRRYVDTGPVMDKAWAVRSGIGWLGKNGNVITRDLGSWVFLGEILTTAVLEYDRPIEDYCGSCTRCLEACPTEAIVEPYVVDARKCISYVTIELRGEHEAQWHKADFQNWVFGCDICQDVCPWNSFAQPTGEVSFAPRAWNLTPRTQDLADIDDETFREHFRKSPVKRTKAEGLRRNARTLLAQRESHRD